MTRAWALAACLVVGCAQIIGIEDLPDDVDARQDGDASGTRDSGTSKPEGLCAMDSDCDEPPSPCHEPGTCDLTTNRCQFPEKLCSSDPCNVGICDSSTGECTLVTGNDGAVCDETACGDWSTCAFSSVCAETGMLSRSCTQYICVAGTCQASMVTEAETCTRQTNGSSCGATSCGTFGSCGGFSNTCDESGTKTRSCTKRTCSSGQCNSIPFSESAACTRDTDGDTCDLPCGGHCSLGRCKEDSCK